MGWTFYKQPGDTQQAQLKHLLRELTAESRGEEYERYTLYSCQRGSVFWQVISLRRVADGEVFKFINCTLLEYDKESRSWGYKSMDEGMGPSYYSCPLGYLDKAPWMTLPDDIANSPYTKSWRERVKLYHRKHQLGDRLILAEGYRVPELVVVQLKPLVGVYGDSLYKIPRDGVIRVVPFNQTQAA